MVYTQLQVIFEFTQEQIRTNASKLIETYSEDLENESPQKLIQLTEILKTDLAEIVSDYQQNLYELALNCLIVENWFSSYVFLCGYCVEDLHRSDGY